MGIKKMELPKIPNPYDNVDSVSSMHMFQLEANFLDAMIRSFRQNMDYVIRGVYIPYLRICWEDVKTLLRHLQPLMGKDRREKYDRIIKRWDYVFMFQLDGKIETEQGEEVDFLSMYGRVLALKLDEIYNEFLIERQRVGLGVAASKPQIFAPGNIGLKPEYGGVTDATV
jgi:hypothetical protein